MAPWRTWALVVAGGLGACTCAPPPDAGPAQPADAAPTKPGAPAGPAGPALAGRVALPPGPDGTVPEVAAWLVAEGPMIAHVERRLQAARESLRVLLARREAAEAEARAAVADADRADQEWRRTMDSDLRSRVEIALRSRDPAAVRTVQGSLLARKKASYGKASRAASASLEKERSLAARAAEIRRFREAAYWLQDLPPAVGPMARSDATGAFSLQAPPGRYALVAQARAGAEGEAAVPTWMLWVEVRDGSGPPVALGADDQLGSGCDACIVPTRDLP